MEAASFALPVVNVGLRQYGRERAPNVLDADPNLSSILSKIETAQSAAFRKSLRGMVNPYGDGHAAERIVQVLTTVPIEGLLRKHATSL
jgi:UDP-N-acetylglucosamine 2-epimerase